MLTPLSAQCWMSSSRPRVITERDVTPLPGRSFDDSRQAEVVAERVFALADQQGRVEESGSRVTSMLRPSSATFAWYRPAPPLRASPFSSPEIGAVVRSNPRRCAQRR